MKTQVAKQRKDYDGDPIEGWSADKQPGYEQLLAVLKELESAEVEGVAEIGADYNDDDDDAIGIVWANYPYFTNGGGNLRDMWAWAAIMDGSSYFGMNLNGEEWIIPCSQEGAAAAAAKKLLEDDNFSPGMRDSSGEEGHGQR